MYAYKFVEHHYETLMDDYTVMYKGKKLSFDEYLCKKECEPILRLAKVKKVVEDSLSNYKGTEDYMVSYNGNYITFDEYLMRME